MTSYKEIIYPSDEKNPYPQKLADHLYDRFIKPLIKEGQTLKVLDIGCCTGNALKMFNKRGNLDLYGIDLRDERSEGFVFKACDLEREKIPFDDNTFDVVYSKSVLEHVKNTDNFVSESLRVLKPGGKFIGMCPDWHSQFRNYWDDYTHVKPFTRKGLRDCLKIHGFQEADCEYFYQLPFLWRFPYLELVVKMIAMLPDSWKWKDRDERNTKDRKLIRFSKEKMLLSFGSKQ
jgi:SAM-dependent methyltransferase